MTEHKCDACGKSLSMGRPGSAASAMMFSLREGQGCPPEAREYMQANLGPYKIDRDYRICYECVLRALGVKP